MEHMRQAEDSEELEVIEEVLQQRVSIIMAAMEVLVEVIRIHLEAEVPMVLTAVEQGLILELVSILRQEHLAVHYMPAAELEKTTDHGKHPEALEAVEILEILERQILEAVEEASPMQIPPDMEEAVLL